MGTRLLTPRMSGLLERMRRARGPALHTLPVAQARAAYESAAEVLDLARLPLPRVEDFEIGRPDGSGLGARLYAPSVAAPLPVLLYLHGGGFTIGSLETHDSLCRRLAAGSGAAVVAIDYRLAPEHRFPAAVVDAWIAMHWLARHGATLGLDATRLAVGGDSAGGTLAAVCALHARDVGLALALQLLITPGTAEHLESASQHLFANGFLLDRVTIEWFFDHYIDTAQRGDWRFAPLNAELDGVAAACLVLAECDPLVDDGIAYGDKLRAAGVPVQLELLRGVTHDFIKMGRALPEAALAQRAAADALRTALHP